MILKNNYSESTQVQGTSLYSPSPPLYRFLRLIMNHTPRPMSTAANTGPAQNKNVFRSLATLRGPNN